jgi:hypothetical protein
MRMRTGARSFIANARRLLSGRARIRFGSFDRVTPVSREFGFDRGLPIDRYYIERFLQMHAGDIRGRALEIGDASYSQRFGGPRVTRQEVLHVRRDAPGATIVGNLSVAGVLPADSLDCAVITQTLHLIYDMRAAVAELHRGLRPGGTALVTAPGISQISTDEWGATWYWSLTELSARTLFGEVFGADNVTVQTFGNVYAATGFIQGVALHEVNRAKLDVLDPCYPVIIGVRATRAT